MSCFAVVPDGLVSLHMEGCFTECFVLLPPKDWQLRREIIPRIAY